jgi:ATP-dependent metalloprotease FtsH
MMVHLRVLSLIRVLSFLGVFPLTFSLKMTYDPDVSYIQKRIANFPEVSYGTLLKRIDAHSLADRIYVSPSLDAVVLEHGISGSTVTVLTHTANPADDEAYETVRINSIVLNSLVEKAQKQGIDTVFLSKIQPMPNPVTQTAGQIYGLVETYLFPAIILLFVFSFISSLVSAGINAASGKRGPPNMFSPPGLNGLSFLDNPADLKTRLKQENVSLASFAGSPEILEECTEVVSFLKNATNYNLAGAELPRGILLEGPPGTGKTLLAKAIASEADAAFLAVSASEFVELYVGIGAQKVRDLFATARENSPCILFIDEIDTVGKQRGGQGTPGNEEREQTLNQLLAEMDGFQENRGILVIAATNRKDTLDAALLRPGRFDRIIRVPAPDTPSREKILKVHSKNKQLENDIDLYQLAEQTQGFTGAQLKNVLNEAAILAARDARTVITAKDIRDSLEKTTVGIIRKSDTRSPKTRERVAVHESGHAILAQNFSAVFELNKVSIQSTYNGAGGYTMFNERKNVTDSGLYTKDTLYKRIVITMGGKAAETIVYGDKQVSLGATQDLQQANDLARKMITQFGFGENEVETYYEKDADVFTRTPSEYTKSKVDKQVQWIVYSAFQMAKRILMENPGEMADMTDQLLRDKTIVY